MMKKRMTALLLMLLCLGNVALAASPAEQTAEALADGGVLSREYPAGSSVSDWRAFILARSGQAGDYEAYADALEDYVTEQYRVQGTLDKTRATEYHRIILTVLALGEDPTAFGTAPDGTPIDLIVDGILNFDDVGAQGLNGVCYALIALHASDADHAEAEQMLLERLLAAQEADGGFGLIAGASEVDITAMAVQALAPYREQCADALAAANDYLAGQMTDSCCFDGESAESNAQVILALTAQGIDPQAELRFTRGSNDLLTALERFRTQDGRYRHMTDSADADAYATVQVLMALTAAEMQGNLYEFSADYAPVQKASGNYIYYILAAAVLAAAGILIGYKKRKK